MSSAAKKKLPRQKKIKPVLISRKARQRSKLPSGNLFSRMLEISNSQAVEMLRDMYRIRHFEEKVFELSGQMKLPVVSLAYAGQEAVAVGACSVLRKDDYITSTQRSHGHCIARGGDVKLMLAELAGKSSGYCRGRGGSMHLADVKAGNPGATGIAVGNIPIATGAALACKFNGKGQVVLCFFGDGAANNGAFHESLNLAAIWNLPVVFIYENNQSPGLAGKAGFRTGNVHTRADSYGMEGVACDGMRALDVREAVSKACQRARTGKGPTLIEAPTHPRRGQNANGAPAQRSKSETEEWKAKDPISQFRIILAESDAVTPAQADAIEVEVIEELQAAAQFVFEGSDDPDLSDVLRGVYKNWIDGPMGLVRNPDLA